MSQLFAKRCEKSWGSLGEATRQEGHLAELSAHVSGALGAESRATAAPAVPGSRELLETVLAEAPQMLPFEDRASDQLDHNMHV